MLRDFVPQVRFFLEVRRLGADLRVTTLTLDPSKREITMKLTKWFLSLSLAGLCLNQASAQSQNPTASRFISDDQDVAELDARPSGFRTANSRSISSAVDSALIAPASTSYISDTEYTANSYPSSGSSGCGLVSCGSGKSTWFSAETLLWFGREQNIPALDTISQQGGLFIPGNQLVSTQFAGADALNSGLLPGYRVSFGRYFGDCDQFGIGGRVFGLYSGEQTDTTTLLGLQTINNPQIDVGTLTASSGLDMVATDGSLYVLLGQSDSHRLDLVGGYSFNRLKSSVGMQTNSTNVFTGDLVIDGTQFTTNDLFETSNVFHGGHLGVLSTAIHNRVSLSTLAKVSFGNMRQSGTVSGSSSSTLNGVAQQFTGGILAQGNNVGTFTRDEFAFIPEMGMKLGYNFRENIEFTVGYTLLMYSSVIMAGDLTDTNVNLTLPADNNNVRDSSFWLQGVDLGFTFSY